MSKQLITSFDPTATASGMFKVGMPQNQMINGVYGYLLMANESSVSLIITINSDNFRVHPWQLEKIVLTEPTQMVTWAMEFILTNNASTPVSLVLVDGFTPDEIVGDAYPIPLVRNTNVGGTVTTAITNTLINDGSVANTVIMESTPLGQPTSAFSFDNSGNVVLRTLSSSVWSIILQIISGGAGPDTALFHGFADFLAAGLQPTTVEIGTDNKNKISDHDLAGSTGQVGIISKTQAIWLCSATNIGQLYNAYFDGTNYRFLTTTSDLAGQLMLSKDALGGTVPRLQIRYSTTGSTADAIITWGQWLLLPQMIEALGTGGTHIFTNTNTPSGQVVGDLWFNG